MSICLLEYLRISTETPKTSRKFFKKSDVKLSTELFLWTSGEMSLEGFPAGTFGGNAEHFL